MDQEVFPLNSFCNFLSKVGMKRLGGIWKTKIRILLCLFLFASFEPPTVTANHSIKFGLHQNKPLNFRDDDGQVKGLVIDVFSHIAEQEGWEIEYVPCIWKDCLEKLENGNIDVLSAIGYTQEREKKYDFNSTPLITNWGMVVIHPAADIQSILDLEGKTIAIMREANHTLALKELLDNFRINAKYLEVDDFIDVFRFVQEQKADAGVVNRLLASQFSSEYYVLKSSIVFNPIEIRYAFTKNRHISKIKIVDKRLLEMRKSPDSLYYQSLSYWFGDNEKNRLPGWLKWLIGASLGLILLFVSVNFLLRHQIKLKTDALYKKNKALEEESRERKIAEAQLRESEERYSLAQKSANIGTWDWDIITGDLKWSEQIEPMFGFAPGEFRATYNAFIECVYPDDREYVIRSINEALYETKEYSIEHRILWPDKTIRWVTEKGNVFRNKNAEPIRMVGVVLDITEQKESFERFRTILNSFDGLVYVADMETYEVLFVNQYGTDIWGDITGKICWQTLQSSQMGPCSFCTNDKLLDADSNPKGPYVWEFKNTVNNEWYECRDQAIKWLDGRIVRMEIASNITERKNNQEQKEKLEEKLRQAHKIEAIGTLAGGIAHDFNNILGIIMGYAGMAREDAPPETQLADNLDHVLSAVNRAKDLVTQILAFSRQSQVERLPMKLQPIIKEGLKMLRSTIPTTISIMENIDPKCGTVFADPTQVHQILMNICTNAYHAMEQTGGVLSVSLKPNFIGVDKKEMLLQVSQGDYVELIVTDTGVGIEPDTIEKIFDPYFTTKEAGKGTGLGLSIVHGIMREYGGTLTVESDIGKGTTVHVYFPVITKDTASEIQEPDEIRMGKERILFVDDEKLLAEMGRLMLEPMGYHVTVRNSSIEALTTFQSRPNEFDIVITDQTMPDMTGSDLACRMMQIRPDIPVILCTGFSNLIDEHSAKSLGIKAFLFKPIKKGTMSKLIRQVLEDS